MGDLPTPETPGSDRRFCTRPFSAVPIPTAAEREAEPWLSESPEQSRLQTRKNTPRSYWFPCRHKTFSGFMPDLLYSFFMLGG